MDWRMVASVLTALIWTLTVVGIAIVVATILQAPLLHASWLPWAQRREGTRLVCDAVAGAAARGTSVEEALAAVHGLVPLGYRPRIALAQGLLDQGAALSEALGRSSLLPPRLARTAAAAEALGKDVLSAWCACCAERLAPTGEALRRQVALMLPYLLLLGGGFAFIGVFILPRFEALFRDLGVALPGELELALHVVRALLPWSIPLALLALAAIATAPWIWHRVLARPSRISRGRLLLHGVARGVPEQELASLLSSTWRSPPRRLHRATGLGDLAAACGWRAVTPESLALALEATGARRSFFRRCASAAAAVFLPLAMAVPVFLLARGVFRAFTAIILALMEAS